MSTTYDMSFWSNTGSPKVSDVSVELDDIIKRLAAGDTSESSSDLPDPENNNVTDPSKVLCTEKCEKVAVCSEKLEESGAEIVCGVQDGQRSPRPATELPSTINTDDVTSRDSQPKPNSCLANACSEGSYSRRKHHKHKDRHREPPAEAAKPKITPVFVWVRQEDCRIVEVTCEDYDSRNRLRLAKTPLGWRAIPKTEIFSAAVIPKAPKPPKSERRKKRKKSRTKNRRHKKGSCSSETVLSTEDHSITPDEASSPVAARSPSEDRDERIRREIKEEIIELSDSPVPKMTKSSSCNFKTSVRGPQMVRSSSLNFKLSSCASATDLDNSDEDDVKYDPEDRVLDMTKHGDLNETDCDELGMLLKEIPNLEDLVEEDEMEDGDIEEITTPKDLTIPKPKDEIRRLPKLPPGISSVVTVSSSTRPPQPLTAPLPEVTITPIPNPKPAHQQRSQNKYLESLLSTTMLIKPEKDEVTITRAKPLKRSAESQECESNPKKVKVEDITLKNLLSKQPFNDKTQSQLDAKSRLQELLTTEPGDPLAQLKQVLSNPHLSVPDPLLVPRERLPALVASPASEIPRLLLEKKLKEAPRPPMTDPNTLVVSLAHLRSLLAYKTTNTEDLAAYQKSLEAFLEWQRYQTELMESQMKNTPPLTPGDIDMATANAFNQMLWLPYLNLDTNRDFMNVLNSVCSPYGQSSPFLTPTSPMENHMKTLAMWQDAVMAQQGANSKLPSPGLPEPALRIPTPGSTPRRRGPHAPYNRQSYEHMIRQKAQYEYQINKQQQHRQVQQQRLLERQRQEQQLLQMQQYQQQFNNYETMTKQLKQDYERRPAKTSSAISVKPLQNLLDKREAKKSNSSWYHFEEDLKKSAELTNQMAKQWQQFEEEMRKSQIQISRKKIKTEASISESLTLEDKKPTVDSDIKPPECVSNGNNVPKLKVKNLAELNVSPVKLLKDPEHHPEHLLNGPTIVEEPVALPEDTQSHLWHPLFGR